VSKVKTPDQLSGKNKTKSFTREDDIDKSVDFDSKSGDKNSTLEEVGLTEQNKTNKSGGAGWLQQLKAAKQAT